MRAYRSKRDEAEALKSLQELERVGRVDGNVMPSIISAVEQHATLGEISDVFRKVFGAHREYTGF